MPRALRRSDSGRGDERRQGHTGEAAGGCTGRASGGSYLGAARPTVWLREGSTEYREPPVAFHCQTLPLGGPCFYYGLARLLQLARLQLWCRGFTGVLPCCCACASVQLEQSNFETAAAALQSKDGAQWEAAVAGYKGGQAWLEPPSPPLPTPTTSAGNSNQSDLAALRGDVDRLLLCCLSTVQFDHSID